MHPDDHLVALLDDVDVDGIVDGQVPTWDAAAEQFVAGDGGGTDDHGTLAGLDDDDHPQYLRGTDGGGHVINVVADAGAAVELDLAVGNVHDVTLTADCTVTLADPAGGRARTMAVLLRQDAAGGHTVTWPASVVWVGGQPPALQTAADTWDWVALVTLDGGTTWFAEHGGTTSAASSDTHREVAMHDYGSGLAAVTDAAGDWLYGIYPGA